nr:MAG TPA: hypothetical protein [Bacteriophage sp.]DAL39157.1 MAG TPA_asm: hypothetical protein [Bacteriophage sp.]DAT93311.1 MAG TPA: hypothetical protein [Caudoviricetes sp.]
MYNQATFLFLIGAGCVCLVGSATGFFVYTLIISLLKVMSRLFITFFRYIFS